MYSTNGSTINTSNTIVTSAGTYAYGVAGSGIIERKGGSTITNATSQTLDTWTSNGYIS